MRNDYQSNYLAHHGILGQKWGIRKYQNPDGSLTEEGRKRYGVNGERKSLGTRIKEDRAAKKKAKQRKAALEKARKAKEEKAKQEKLAKEYEEKKQEVLRSGSAKEVLKYRGSMTNNELNAALNRINWEKQLNDLAKKEEPSGFDQIDKAFKTVGKVGDWANSTYKTYTAFQRMMKLLDEDDDKK